MIGLREAGANAIIDALTSLISGGTLRIYAGLRGAQNAQSLAVLGLGSPAFHPALNGQAAANPVTRDDNPAKSGLATWYAACDAGGAVVFTGQVNGDDPDLVLSSPTIEAHGPVFLTEWTLRMPTER